MCRETGSAPDARELGVAIRKKCLECSGGMKGEVTRCRLKGCALWPYRINPTAPRASKQADGQIDVFELMKEA